MWLKSPVWILQGFRDEGHVWTQQIFLWNIKASIFSHHLTLRFASTQACEPLNAIFAVIGYPIGYTRLIWSKPDLDLS